MKEQKNKETTEFTVLFDNIPFSPQRQTEWGYSCFIKNGEESILFDTGSNGDVLRKNMSTLHIDPRSYKTIVISHIHWDHIDGLFELLQDHANVVVYLPNSSSKTIEADILKTGAEVVRVDSFLKIRENLFSLGELNGNIPEQSLAVQTQKGIVILTGCAHPGIVPIIEHARSCFRNEPVYLVMGGFHLKDDDHEKMTQTVKTMLHLGVERIAPSHCTGEKAMEEFENMYKNRYIKSGVGRKITIEGGE